MGRKKVIWNWITKNVLYLVHSVQLTYSTYTLIQVYSQSIILIIFIIWRVLIWEASKFWITFTSRVMRSLYMGMFASLLGVAALQSLCEQQVWVSCHLQGACTGNFLQKLKNSSHLQQTNYSGKPTLHLLLLSSIVCMCILLY